MAILKKRKRYKTMLKNGQDSFGVYIDHRDINADTELSHMPYLFRIELSFKDNDGVTHHINTEYEYAIYEMQAIKMMKVFPLKYIGTDVLVLKETIKEFFKSNPHIIWNEAQGVQGYKPLDKKGDFFASGDLQRSPLSGVQTFLKNQFSMEYKKPDIAVSVEKKKIINPFISEEESRRHKGIKTVEKEPDSKEVEKEPGSKDAENVKVNDSNEPNTKILVAKASSSGENTAKTPDAGQQNIETPDIGEPNPKAIPNPGESKEAGGRLAVIIQEIESCATGQEMMAVYKKHSSDLSGDDLKFLHEQIKIIVEKRKRQ